METMNENVIDNFLIKHSEGDKNLLALLQVSVGRALRRGDKEHNGVSLAELDGAAKDGMKGIVDCLKIAIAIDADWLHDLDEGGYPSKFTCEMSIEDLAMFAWATYIYAANFETLLINLQRDEFDFSKFPKGIKIYGDLDGCNNCFYQVPEGLHVVGSVDLRLSAIQFLPQDLTVEGTLDLTNSQIVELPERLTVGAGLKLKRTKIKSLPDDLQASGYVDLRGSEIETLPENFEVGEGVNVSNTPLVELPKGFKTGGFLDISNTAITSLPDDIVVMNKLVVGKNILAGIPAAIPDDIIVETDAGAMIVSDYRTHLSATVQISGPKFI